MCEDLTKDCGVGQRGRGRGRERERKREREREEERERERQGGILKRTRSERYLGSSVTRWLYYLFTIWPFTTMNI